MHHPTILDLSVGPLYIYCFLFFYIQIEIYHLQGAVRVFLTNLNGSGRKKNKILCLPLVISKLLCLPDGLEGLNYYNEYHFENVSFGIQRHQIKVLVLWNFNTTHIWVVAVGNIIRVLTYCYLETLQC